MSNNGNRGYLTRDEAEPHLSPVIPTLLDSFWEAWEWSRDLIARDELARAILYSSTRAGIVSDAFGWFARPRLISEFQARWTARGRFQQAIIGQVLALRFKKLTPDLHSMNIKTESQRKVYQQDNALLPNGRPLTGITLGYTLNKVASDVTGLYITCTKDFDRNAWVWPVYQAGGQMNLFTGTPPPPDAPVEDVLNVDIKLKRRKRENG